MDKIYQCRACKQPINTALLDFGTDYVMPKKGVYYHTKCYEAKKNISLSTNTDNPDDVYLDALYRYMRYDLVMNVNFVKVRAQWTSYLNNTMTAKGIYYTVQYMYEVKHFDKAKAEGGIGLVPSLYAESSAYWTEIYTRQGKFPDALAKQQELIDQQITVIVNRKKKEKPTQRWQLLEGDNDG